MHIAACNVALTAFRYDFRALAILFYLFMYLYDLKKKNEKFLLLN
jgi:hypothetical protein